MAAGHMLRSRSFPRWPIRIIPLGSVPKKQTEERRRISDFSFPAGLSVNGEVDVSRLPELRYTRVWDLVDHLRELRISCPTEPILMCKVDIAAAYRQAPTRLADVWMCVYHYDGWF